MNDKYFEIEIVNENILSTIVALCQQTTNNKFLSKSKIKKLITATIISRKVFSIFLSLSFALFIKFKVIRKKKQRRIAKAEFM